MGVFSSVKEGCIMIVASMASIPQRIEGLRAVVESIYPQVDQLNVFLDEWPEVPTFLAKPNIQVERSQERGRWGDAGKFYWCDQVKGVYFTLDDDMFYPPDYISKSIDGLVRWGGGIIGGYYGVILNLLKDNKISWARWQREHVWSRRAFWHSKALEDDTQVHMLGTALVCYFTDAVELYPSDFKVPNMADLWLALQAQKQQVPMICFERKARWIRDNIKMRDVSSGICGDPMYHQNIRDVETEVVKTTEWFFPKLPRMTL